MSARPIVLAAGAGTRLGGPKAVRPVRGQPMLERVLACAAEAGLPTAVVVAGADVAGVEAIAAAGDGPRPQVVAHAGWAAGRSGSLAAGLRALAPDDAAWLLWPVDVCLVGPELVRALLRAREAHPTAQAWIPSHGGRRGHPALFARAQAAAFLGLTPDQPAREVVRALAARPGALVHVDAPDAACLIDIDTPQDLARAEEWLR